MAEQSGPVSVRMAAQLLAQTSLFNGLAARPLAELAAAATLLRVPAGAHVYRRDDPGNALYILGPRSAVDVVVAGPGGGELVLTQAGPLECVGDLGLLDGLSRSDSARAVVDSTALALPREAVLRAAVTAPAVVQRLLAAVGGTLRRVLEHAAETSFMDLHERVIRALVEIEARIARGAPAPTLEQLHHQLPTIVGATPEAVEEVLHSFEELGYLEAGRERVRISGNRSQRGVLSGGLSWTALVNQVLHDPLTQLANRMLFHERLHQAVTDEGDGRTTTAVLMIDLDGFKQVNDTLGHAAGDELLVKVADRLRGCLRRPDTAARLGGDEFAVVVTEVDSPESATRVADRVLTAVGRPFLIGDEIVQVGASIGVALGLGHQDEELVALLGRADAAMYRAKRAGKRRWELAREVEEEVPEATEAASRRLVDRRQAPEPREARAPAQLSIGYGRSVGG